MYIQGYKGDRHFESQKPTKIDTFHITARERARRGMYKVAGQLRAAGSANNQAEDFIRVVQTNNLLAKCKALVGRLKK